MFADGLGAASLALVRPAVSAQWRALLAALVPLLEARVEADAALPAPPQGRLRVGLYTYSEGVPVDAAPPPSTPALRAPKPRKPTP